MKMAEGKVAKSACSRHPVMSKTCIGEEWHSAPTHQHQHPTLLTSQCPTKFPHSNHKAQSNRRREVGNDRRHQGIDHHATYQPQCYAGWAGWAMAAYRQDSKERPPTPWASGCSIFLSSSLPCDTKGFSQAARFSRILLAGGLEVMRLITEALMDGTLVRDCELRAGGRERGEGIRTLARAHGPARFKGRDWRLQVQRLD